jgi:hypothetical protein
MLICQEEALHPVKFSDVIAGISATWSKFVLIKRSGNFHVQKQGRLPDYLDNGLSRSQNRHIFK